VATRRGGAANYFGLLYRNARESIRSAAHYSLYASVNSGKRSTFVSPCDLSSTKEHWPRYKVISI